MNCQGRILFAGQVGRDLRKQINQAAFLVQRPSPGHQTAGWGGGLRTDAPIADQSQQRGSGLNFGRSATNRGLWPCCFVARIRLSQEQRSFAFNHSAKPSSFDRRQGSHGTTAAIEPRRFPPSFVGSSDRLAHCAATAAARLAAIRDRFPARLALAIHRLSVLDERAKVK